MAQATWVASCIRRIDPAVRSSIEVIATSGDRPAGPAHLGDGIFVREIQEALLRGDVDVAVHSMKDLPTQELEGIRLAAVPERVDPRDAMIGGTLAGLAPGSLVGTSSPRRVAQMLHFRPDLEPSPIRGNVPTRIDKVRSGSYDAAILAAAGLRRLGLEPDELLGFDRMLPAPGQGALAVEVRDSDSEAYDLFSRIDSSDRAAVLAERAVLRALGGGCLLPIAVLAEREGESWRVTAAATSSDGARQVRLDEFDRDVMTAAQTLAARLIEHGAKELLDG